MTIPRCQISVLPAVLVLFATAGAYAQTKPDFSGTWVLNAAKSETAGHPPPEVTVKIRHHDPELLITHTVSGETSDWKLGTDGKEYVNETPEGTMRATFHWDKEALAGVIDFAGRMTFKDLWSLENDGRTIRIARHVAGENGEQDWTLIFDKQPDK